MQRDHAGAHESFHSMMVLSVSFPRLKQPSYFCAAGRTGVRRGMLKWRFRAQASRVCVSSR